MSLIRSLAFGFLLTLTTSYAQPVSSVQSRPSPVEQALGEELIACVRAKVALRAEISSTKHVANTEPKPASDTPPVAH